MESQNPCRKCDLLPADKNNSICQQCDQRAAYVRSIGGMTHSLPAEHANFSADRKTTKKGETSTVMKTLQQAELFVQKYCSSYNLDIEVLRNGRRTKRWAYVRHDLAVRLRRSYDLTQEQIGELLNLRGPTVSGIFKTKGIDFKSAYSPDVPADDFKSIKPADIFSDADRIEAENPFKKTQTLQLDFIDHPDLYSGLQALAADELRTLDQQVLYLIKREIEQRGTLRSI